MQSLLPFQETTVPARHVEWLRLANAGEYSGKKSVFYPFKSRFCHAHGVADGMDLQTITLKCWCGDGIWRGSDDRPALPATHWERCNRCGGTGIYLRKQILLVRWIVGGAVFHEPSPIVYRPGTVVQNRFDGLIQHPHVPSVVAMRAMERLLLRYEPDTLIALYRDRLSIWRWNQKMRVQRGFYWLNQRLRACFGKPEDDGVPF